ncbi:MAG: multicopper oxidase domain-containing protein [Gemmatimonadaceae bacterium]
MPTRKLAQSRQARALLLEEDAVISATPGVTSVMRLAAALTIVSGPSFWTSTPRPTTAAPHVSAEDAVAVAAEPNDNRLPAGKLVNGILTVRLEAREAMWYPEGRTAPGVPVYAFATSRSAPGIPGPLIRVRAGTEIRAIVTNSLKQRMTLRGLQDHSASALDTIEIAPGAEREITFNATIPGTFYYWGRTEGNREGPSRLADSQLAGAFIVDPPGANTDPRDRVMVISLWEDTLRTIPEPAYKEVFAINGLSWPHTERLNYTVGDTIRYRLINATAAPHPMHLHGFYFDVTSKGNAVRDTIYTVRQRRKAVTEFMPPGTTTAFTWVPTRAGNWLLHCHLISHIDAHLKLTSRHSSSGVHSGNHSEEGMSGLVMGLHVSPRAGGVAMAPDPVAQKQLRMFVDQRDNVFGKDPGYSFVLQNGPNAPAADSVQFPSSTVVVTKGEPTAITVINRTKAPVSVHWHGIELESFYDGVGDWSGWKKKLAPPIAPGDSFIVRMTPDRAGTFIYHTHVDETIQLSSGLYGALIVLEKGAKRDTTERLFLMGDGGPVRGSPSFLNGTATPPDIQLSSGTPHRLRFINISGGPSRRVRLMADTTLQRWRAVAKDGADLPTVQANMRPADLQLGPGETMDVEVAREKPEEMQLEVTTLAKGGVVTTIKVPVRVK